MTRLFRDSVISFSWCHHSPRFFASVIVSVLGANHLLDGLLFTRVAYGAHRGGRPANLALCFDLCYGHLTIARSLLPGIKQSVSASADDLPIVWHVQSAIQLGH